MPAYYRAALAEFSCEDANSVLGKLTKANAVQRFPLTYQAIDAWRVQLPVLQAGATHLLQVFADARNWSLLLEYPIPIVGKRIDAVLLAQNLILVIEVKTGASPTSAARQVDDYALNLACFHEHCGHRPIVPLVVSDSQVVANSTATTFDSLVEACRFSSSKDVGAALERICGAYLSGEEQIEAGKWDCGRFRPIPPIIDAAVALYSDMDVFEIGHSCAAREDLEKTTNFLVNTILEARANQSKAICFTTGVPGAGKTLVGLNTVHRAELKDFTAFLSGNGPLVKVIQEALIRDVVKRSQGQSSRVSRREAQLKVQAFVHNVHRFADEYYGEGHQRPVQKVIVFDEAQRAWDEDQNERAGRPRVSEAKMMLEVMSRHSDWAAIVALIGGGQEINRGEAGLAEWGRALADFPEWRVYASPHVLGKDSLVSFRLFEDHDRIRERVVQSPELHLKVCTRSIRAQRISEWVDAVLDGKDTEAKRISGSLDAKPMLTRDLGVAKRWLKANQRGRTRAGLVACASAARLRADGIEPTFDFHQRFDWEHWFLDLHECENPDCDHKYCNDVRASSTLEVAATQFEVQGLELDWVGLCWGEDLVWDGTGWTCHRFNNKKWKAIRESDQRRKMYLVNAYRVLMTRARQGMVIYVPAPEKEDKTRSHNELHNTARFLVDCGVISIS